MDMDVFVYNHLCPIVFRAHDYGVDQQKREINRIMCMRSCLIGTAYMPLLSKKEV